VRQEPPLPCTVNSAQETHAIMPSPQPTALSGTPITRPNSTRIYKHNIHATTFIQAWGNHSRRSPVCHEYPAQQVRAPGSLIKHSTGTSDPRDRHTVQPSRDARSATADEQIHHIADQSSPKYRYNSIYTERYILSSLIGPRLHTGARHLSTSARPARIRKNRARGDKSNYCTQCNNYSY